MTVLNYLHLIYLHILFSFGQNVHFDVRGGISNLYHPGLIPYLQGKVLQYP